MIPVGSMLGHFRILRKIGSGGMGSIFVALDTMLHRKVALKVIHDHLLGKPECMEAFKKEASTQAQLSHPNIVSLYAFHAVGDHHAMVMEYVEGESLREILKRQEYLAVSDVIRYMKQLLRGLLYAHGMNIVHLDIKPGNLIRTPAGKLKITDFGIAAIAGLHHEAKKGCVFATPWYASPEQLYGRPADHRSDLFSSGITMYEMLTGQIPFNATAWDPENPRSWVERIKGLPPPSAKRQGISPGLDEFVLKCIQREPERRFQHAGEMLAVLDEIEAGAPRT